MFRLLKVEYFINRCTHGQQTITVYLHVNQHKQSTDHLFPLPRCNMPIHHMRAVRVCSRQSGQSTAKPSWEQRISWWSSTIKRLLYVNCVKPLWERRVNASLISCPVNPQQTDLKPADPWLNSYGEKRSL